MRLRSRHVVLALMFGLMGCSDIAMSTARSTTGRAPEVAEVPGKSETVRGAEDPAIVTLEVASRLRERRMTRSEDLPGSIIVPNTNLNAVPVTAALQAVLSGTDVSLAWNANSFDQKLVSVSNLSGSLPKVVEKICNAAKIFCSYRNGLLEMKDKETFIVELPAMPMTTKSGSSSSSGAANTMADAITELAGDKVKLDTQGGNLMFTSDVDGYERVHEYLDQLRNGRPLLVMQLYIWEVTLNKADGAGINWKSFSLRNIGTKAENMMLSGSTGFSSLDTPGVSLGAKFAGHITADTVLEFLSTQGTVQTISNPQMTFVSGSSAEFRVGGKQRYISQIGSLTTSTVSSSSNSVGTNTVSTDSLETGLTVNLNGNYENGVISAMMELTMQDVVSLNPTTVDTMTIDLPETTERKVTSTLRVRPGDNLVLAGLVSSRDQNTREGVPFFGMRFGTYGSDTLKNSELVIMVKPSIVMFSDKRLREEERAQKQSAFSGARSLPDPVVIDKDGSKTMKLPASGRTPVASEELPVPTSRRAVKPELMVSDDNAAPTGQTHVTIGADGAPVDKRLMQRGFSHAYDDLLDPAGSVGGGS